MRQCLKKNFFFKIGFQHVALTSLEHTPYIRVVSDTASAGMADGYHSTWLKAGLWPASTNTFNGCHCGSMAEHLTWFAQGHGLHIQHLNTTISTPMNLGPEQSGFVCVWDAGGLWLKMQPWCCCWFYETGSHCVEILRPQASRWWDYRQVSPSLVALRSQRPTTSHKF